MKFRLFILFLILPFACWCQKLISEDEAVNLALKNDSQIKASIMEVDQSKQLQKTAYNFNNPEIMMESPTGKFQTVGVMQSIDFPTVYIKQHKLYKQQTVLADAGKKISENDVKYQIKTLYLSVQYADYIFEQYKMQDSIYAKLKSSALRLYEAGQIDFLEKTMAETQYGEVHNQFIQAETDLAVALSQLQISIGIKETVSTNKIQRSSSSVSILAVKIDTTVIQNNPVLLYSKQEQIISKKNLSLERNRMLPGLTFGYLNQAERSTPMDMRLRFGITVPLWFWQYTGSIKAAKIGLKIAEQKMLSKQQALSIDMQKAQGDYLKYSQSLAYYENTGLKLTDEILSASKRFFESGQQGLVPYLRNMNEAYLIKLRYAESLKNYNQSVININYLSGNL
ncbi:MAG: outer rane efflux protein [Bacteroidetes bacterium]|jgi:outer membrane protein TolC|nr:outer rane efflux protein [Bacteroidota bacterium]